MKKNILTICLITFSLLSWTTVLSQEIKAKAMTENIKEKIQELNNNLSAANVAGETEAVLSFYAEDIIYMPNYGPMIRGKEAMKDYEMKAMESGVKITAMTLTTLEATDMGDMVYEIGSYEITMEIPGMKEPWSDKGKYVSIYRKIKGGALEMVVDIWNTDVNPWEMMSQEKKPE